MPVFLTRAFRARYYECDAYGRVNNVNYLRYMQKAAFDASAARHYTITRVRVRDGALVVRIGRPAAWVDLAAGRPMRIPDQFLADFAPNVAHMDV